MKKQCNLFFAPKNGIFETKKVEITLISRAISTSVTQRYKIPKRNANPLTLVNTNIILHFSSFFGSENGVDIMNYFGNNIGAAPSEIYACIAPVGGHYESDLQDFLRCLNTNDNVP